MNNTRIFVGVAAVVAILAGTSYFLMGNRDAGGAPIAPNPLDGAVGSTSTSATIGNATTSKVVIGANIAKPKNFDRPLAFPSSITADIRAKLQLAFDADVAKIKESNDMNAWGDLAILRKITEDYQGAVEIFSYISKVYPGIAGPYASLGDLYASYLKDYVKADANYLKAISIEPLTVGFYIELHTLYRGPYQKSATAAEDILKQGIKVNPASYQLQLALARYYGSKGKIAEAKLVYDSAISIARAQNLATVVSQIEEEKAALK